MTDRKAKIDLLNQLINELAAECVNGSSGKPLTEEEVFKGFYPEDTQRDMRGESDRLARKEERTRAFRATLVPKKEGK